MSQTLQDIANIDQLFADLLKSECNTGDNESDHVRADDLIVELLKALCCDKSAEEYANQREGFWYA